MKLSRLVINKRSVGEHPVTLEGWHAFYLAPQANEKPGLASKWIVERGAKKIDRERYGRIIKGRRQARSHGFVSFHCAAIVRHEDQLWKIMYSTPSTVEIKREIKREYELRTVPLMLTSRHVTSPNLTAPPHHLTRFTRSRSEEKPNGPRPPPRCGAVRGSAVEKPLSTLHEKAAVLCVRIAAQGLGEKKGLSGSSFASPRGFCCRAQRLSEAGGAGLCFPQAQAQAQIQRCCKGRPAAATDPRNVGRLIQYSLPYPHIPISS
jgi:hypothetical protein